MGLSVGGGGVRKAEGHEMRSIYIIICIPLLILMVLFSVQLFKYIFLEFKKICVSKLGPKGSKLGEGIHFVNICM